MKCEIVFTNPYEEPGFVEYKRAFSVVGRFKCDGPLPDDAALRIELIEGSGKVVRTIAAEKKQGPMDLFREDLVFYPDGIDDDRTGLLDFGMAELCVNGREKGRNFTNAEIKCWFSDEVFKGIFISASDKEHGAILDDGVHFTDKNGNPYTLLECGDYTLRAVLYSGTDIIAVNEKKLKVGRRDRQLICRFNPESHKKKMEKWSREIGASVIIDPLPGYLDPYRGWLYHMGLLKMYRANDVPLFETADVHMFVYLIDGESTSYKTELAYLQSVSAVNERVHSYYYDIGEAEFCGLTGQILEFDRDVTVVPQRIDIVMPSAEEGKLKLNGEDVLLSQRTDVAIISANAEFAVAGVIKPIQLDPGDFIINDDNTYTINNGPDTVTYVFTCDGLEYTEVRKVGLTRFWDDKHDNSVFEFYNVFKVRPEWVGKELTVKGTVNDGKGNRYSEDFTIELKEKG